MWGELFTLRQGTRSVADYVADFHILSEESGWNKSALLCAFRQGLNELVCDAVVTGMHQRGLVEDYLCDRAG